MQVSQLGVCEVCGQLAACTMVEVASCVRRRICTYCQQTGPPNGFREALWTPDEPNPHGNPVIFDVDGPLRSVHQSMFGWWTFPERRSKGAPAGRSARPTERRTRFPATRTGLSSTVTTRHLHNQ